MQLSIYTSSVLDGTMKGTTYTSAVQENRSRFLLGCDIDLLNTTAVNVVYGSENYARYVMAEKAFDSPSDSVFTCSNTVALFLPLADCIGAVLYDPKNNILGMAHLGRHNLVQNGGVKNIQYMQHEFGSNPKDIMVFMSAAASKAAYPMHDFNGMSLHEVALKQFEDAGVLTNNIDADARDTVTDDTLFSHSDFLKGNQVTDGRHALVAIMR